MVAVQQKKNYLTDVRKAERLRFAREHIHYTNEFWRKKIGLTKNVFNRRLFAAMGSSRYGDTQMLLSLQNGTAAAKAAAAEAKTVGTGTSGGSLPYSTRFALIVRVAMKFIK